MIDLKGFLKSFQRTIKAPFDHTLILIILWDDDRQFLADDPFYHDEGIIVCVFSTSILDTLIVLRRNQWMEGDMNDFLALVPFDYETAVRLYAGCLGTILSIWWSSLLLLSLWIYTIHHFHCLTVVWCSFCLLPLLTHPPLSDIYKKTLHFPHLKSSQ